MSAQMKKALGYPRTTALACAVILPILILFIMSFFNDGVGIEQNFRKSIVPAKATGWNTSQSLRIVTFNIQDLLFVATKHEERMRGIAVALEKSEPDIVGFQESFSSLHRKILQDKLVEKTSLEYFRYFPSGRVGSGLFIASRFPIEEVFFLRFQHSNPWYKVWEGDFWAGKGAGLARIKLAERQYIDFINTHAQADYGVPANEDVRYKQMTELARFVNDTGAPTIPAIIAGDINCKLEDPDFTVLVDGAKLDRLMRIDSKVDHIFGVTREGYTYETIESISIEETLSSGKDTFALSDHNGYLSEIRITPLAPTRSK
jgi:sphingomyelin phosphodiesterase 2